MVWKVVNFFRELAENIDHLNKIILYTYSGEKETELARKNKR